MYKGTIQWFCGNRNLGLITPDDTLRWSTPIEGKYLSEEARCVIQDGIRVRFEFIETDSGPRVRNIMPIQYLGICFHQGNRKNIIFETIDINEPIDKEIKIENKNNYKIGFLYKFYLKWNTQLNGWEPYLSENISESNCSNDVINNIIHIANPNILINFIIPYFELNYSNLSINELSNVINIYFNKFTSKNLIPDVDKLIIIKNIFPNLLLMSDYLRMQFIIKDLSSYIEFLNNKIKLKDIDESIIFKSINQDLMLLEEPQLSIYWNSVNYLHNFNIFRCELWKFMPRKDRKILIEKYYDNLFNSLNIKQLIIESDIDELSKIIWNDIEDFELIDTVLVIEKKLPILILKNELIIEKLKRLDIAIYFTLINSLIQKEPQHIELIDSMILSDIVKDYNPDTEIFTWFDNKINLLYWNNVPHLNDEIKYGSRFWKVAPIDVKIEIIKNRYNKFFELMNLYYENTPESTIINEMSWDKLYDLNDDEIKLITNYWPMLDDTDYDKAKFISARGAEKLAIEYYKSMNYEVEDVSIQQIFEISDEWKKTDLILDNNIPIDVKNARSDVNSNIYSDFCVPSFKKLRNKDVIILSVLSPYISIKYIKNNEIINFKINNPIILGEFNKLELNNLQSIFSDDNFKLNLHAEKNNKEITYLSPWLFDHNTRYYKNRNNILSKIHSLSDDEVPPFNESVLVHGRRFSPLLASQRNLSEAVVSHLTENQRNFVNNFKNNSNEFVTLPYLYLNILKDFIQNVIDGDEEYTPDDYIYILSDKEFNSNNNFRINKQRLLGIEDPLNIILNLIDTLNILWNSKDKTNLIEYKIFKFSGRGLLRAKKNEKDEKWTTIIAYCGGRIHSFGKCGFSPLIVGMHETCSVCGRLICPEYNCGYCSDGCPNYADR